MMKIRTQLGKIFRPSWLGAIELQQFDLGMTKGISINISKARLLATTNGQELVSRKGRAKAERRAKGKRKGSNRKREEKRREREEKDEKETVVLFLFLPSSFWLLMVFC